MPIATLTFNLPDEREEYETTMKASSYAAAIWELDQTHLRSATKYDNIPTPVWAEILKAFSKSDYSNEDLEMLALMASENGRRLILETLGGVRTLLYEITNRYECTQ